VTLSRVVLGVLAAAALVALVIGASRPEGESQRAPRTSSTDESPQGLTILAALLGESGRQVRRVSSSPNAGSLESGETAILLDAGSIVDEDARALAAFVEGGGRLIIGGDVAASALEEASGVSVRADPGSGESLAVPLVPVAETAGISTIEAGTERFSDTGAALPIAGDSAGDLAAIAGVGEGDVVLLADSAPLQNGTIASADNAAFAVALTGEEGRTVAFVESLAGKAEGEAEGFGALPSRWAYAAMLLLVAGLAFIWAHLRRLGGPDQDARELPPPRSRYVDALAAALARTNSAPIAGEPVRLEARRRLLASAGLGEDADPDMLAAAAARQGLEPEQAAALGGPLEDDRAAIHAGAALAKLWR